MRAGGKHNDLENVGYTARHHTFFEMLGNFSFGDYFKRDAIRCAWEFLTGRRSGCRRSGCGSPSIEDDDEAAASGRRDRRRPRERIIAHSATTDNFWQMGDTGPCGPCTEIFYDHGPRRRRAARRARPTTTAIATSRSGTSSSCSSTAAPDGTLTPLPKPSVDTGMGLERIAAVLQGVHTNYEIDLFANLIEAAADAHAHEPT